MVVIEQRKVASSRKTDVKLGGRLEQLLRMCEGNQPTEVHAITGHLDSFDASTNQLLHTAHPARRYLEEGPMRALQKYPSVPTISDTSEVTLERGPTTVGNYISTYTYY